MSDLTRVDAPRRNVAAVALAVALLAIVGVGFVTQRSDTPDTIATADDATTTTTATTIAPVFVAAASTQTAAPDVDAPATTADAPAESTPPSTAPPTTARPTTTRATTTTVAPTTVAETLPETPTEPIAPPPDPRGYEEQVQLGRISIPALDIDWPLLEGIRLTTLDNGPGHWPGTAMPGEVGNVVVAAHRTSHGGPFRHIDTLVAGDTVTFSTDAGDVDYTVTGTQIVGPDAMWIVNPTDTPTATLFACHPPGSTRQRIVVNLELS